MTDNAYKIESEDVGNIVGLEHVKPNRARPVGRDGFLHERAGRDPRPLPYGRRREHVGEPGRPAVPPAHQPGPAPARARRRRHAKPGHAKGAAGLCGGRIEGYRLRLVGQALLRRGHGAVGQHLPLLRRQVGALRRDVAGNTLRGVLRPIRHGPGHSVVLPGGYGRARGGLRRDGEGRVSASGRSCVSTSRREKARSTTATTSPSTWLGSRGRTLRSRSGGLITEEIPEPPVPLPEDSRPGHRRPAIRNRARGPGHEAPHVWPQPGKPQTPTRTWAPTSAAEMRTRA